MTWIPHPISLHGEQVSLVPLSEEHFDDLIALSKDPQIWRHYALDGGHTPTLKASLENALVERDLGWQYPFVVVLHPEQKIIGSTRFLEIQAVHKKLEIGWTWLHPEYWGARINAQCKMLLLTYCFEELGAFRVQLKTDEHNLRSRIAIEKIGGRFEGIFRNDMLRDNGTLRDSVYFSIIASEWPATKRRLEKLCNPIVR